MSKFFRSKFIDRRLLMFRMLFKSKFSYIHSMHRNQVHVIYLEWPGINAMYTMKHSNVNDFGLYTMISSIFVVVKFILKKISIHFHLLFFMIWDIIHLMINGCFCFSQLITYLIYYTCCSDDRVNSCSTFTGRIHLTLSYILKSFAGFLKIKLWTLSKNDMHLFSERDGQS